MPQLSIINEDETTETTQRGIFSPASHSEPTNQIQSSAFFQRPSQTPNSLSVPNVNQHLMKMDPLIKLLYQEISESTDQKETTDSSDAANDLNHEKVGGEEDDIAISHELIEKVRTAIIKRQLSGTDIHRFVNGNGKQDSIYGKDSILIAPPDIETLKKAAEFRGAYAVHV